MVNTLKESFDKYFDTLRAAGSVPVNEPKILIVMSFLKKYVYSQSVQIGMEEIKQLENLFNCLIPMSCTIDDMPQLVPAGSASGNGNVVTQGGITIISNDGTNLATQSGTDVRKFSDFAFQPSLGSEDFLAGYDSSLNENIRVNAGSLILTWQPI